MNISEIAELCGVSVSTISKIINKKDKNISSETREHVLKIVKENNYRPYSGIQNSNSTFLVGVILTREHIRMENVIAKRLRDEGYAAILCPAENREEELKSINTLIGYHVAGIIWEKISDNGENLIKRAGIPYRKIDFSAYSTEENASFDYEKLGFSLAKCLIEHKHKNIFCFIDRLDKSRELFVEGFKKCLYENKLPFDDKMIFYSGNSDIQAEYFYAYSGAVCFSEKLAAQLYSHCMRKNKRIPKYMSVVSLINGDENGFILGLSGISLPYEELGLYVVKRLLAQIESRRVPEIAFHSSMELNSLSSVNIPLLMRSQRIVVVGSLNMDTILSLKEFPKVGETLTAQFRTTMPGGKGLNQAVGVARLGTESCLIGKIGKDYEGGELYDFLLSNDVNADGVSNTSHIATGQAYIQVQNDGESGIVVYDGANSRLSPHDIKASAKFFENTAFCLLQTEIDMETVEYAAELAQKMNVRVLLKPAAVSCLSDTLLSMVDILLPNEMEIDRLCPSGSTEEKAQKFIDRGVKNIIITLGQRGCFWSDGKSKMYFPAARFDVVDTTGAADAFAAALAVYLSRGKPMKDAIRYATVAAGFSTTKRGVPPSLIDHSTLEFLMLESDKYIPNIKG